MLMFIIQWFLNNKNKISIVKHLVILFFFFSEFAIGQLPGNPKFPGKSAYPQAFAAAEISGVTEAILTGYIIDNGQKPVTETGIIWGSTAPTLTVYDGGVVSKIGAGTITTTITGLALAQIVYARAYAKMGTDLIYGNVEIYEHGIVITQTGRKWMAYNVGSNPAKSSNDVDAYNTLYQWGRTTDGHQVKTSTINKITVLSSLPTTYNAGIVGTSFIQPYYGSGGNPFLYYNATSDINGSKYGDWLNPSNAQLWQGVYGINNPCPSGYRLPTASEFTAEVNKWASLNNTGAFNSKLKLSIGGFRLFNDPTAISTSTNGFYWTSTTGLNAADVMKAYYLNTSNGTLSLGYKANGYAVRCIKEYSGSGISSGGTAEVSSYDCPATGANGQIVWDKDVSLTNVKQIIQANVTTPGTYNLTTAYSNGIESRSFHNDYGYTNGVIFTGSGTFTSTGLQNVELTASGLISQPYMAFPPNSKSYSLINVGPSCNFSRTEVNINSGGSAWFGNFTSEPAFNTERFTIGSTAQVAHRLKVYATWGGTYNISTSVTDAQGSTVTFSGSGSVNTGNAQIIYLYSSGKFLVAGDYTFYLPNYDNRINSTEGSGAFTRKAQ